MPLLRVHLAYSQVILVKCRILGDYPKDRQKCAERVTKQAKLRESGSVGSGERMLECRETVITTFK